ncbi:MAG TPA: hypothetical protein VJ728_17895, partial [Candidatus Binataceae bacterium]|nr:hypothetical protein [Candidatus Binataceae bacterium]
MSEVLSRIFTDEILARLRKCKHYSRSAEFRHRVICSLPPVGDSAYTQQFYEQTRARWNRWVGAAISIGLFEDPYGAELKAR